MLGWSSGEEDERMGKENPCFFSFFALFFSFVVFILYNEICKNFFRKNRATSLANAGRWISSVDGAQSLTRQVNSNRCRQVGPLPFAGDRLVGLLPCFGTFAHVPIGLEASRPFSPPYPLPLSLLPHLAVLRISARSPPDQRSMRLGSPLLLRAYT
jgi:hypothetical protein